MKESKRYPYFIYLFSANFDTKKSREERESLVGSVTMACAAGFLAMASVIGVILTI